MKGNELIMNTNMNNEIMIIAGVNCYEKDNIVYLKLEDVARGLGFTTKVEKNGVEYENIRWSRVDGYLSEFGFLPEVAENEKRPEFIPENIFYRLAMKAKNDIAEKFKTKVADEIMPTIRRTGGYVQNDELFANTYLPFADDNIKNLFKQTLSVIRSQNEMIEKQMKENKHKQKVIDEFSDNVELPDKRRMISTIVRYGARKLDYAPRWNTLYKMYENKNHMNLSKRVDNYNTTNNKNLSKIDYIEEVLNDIGSLFNMSVQIFESSRDALLKKLGIVIDKDCKVLTRKEGGFIA